ncbi:hypothetical protein BGZ61DRAFT_572185 [Ilyonectria robusta]|uniref:uncharacterized protein n=1 Tax=Ilyonectria robusta TaxID=1079257 RepID=UPI001E8CD115|nr:uncharacterized protein BGZ61DRAFT_572185 [Ilyonectria robusta]KAH8721968.1 hypothetical protein BGZ61DRAFT_572185 [Ilyonectria robusta]
MRLVWGAHAKPTNRGALAAPPITGGPAPKLAGHDTTSRALPARYQAPQGWPLAPQALPEAPAVASAVRDGVPPSNCVLPRRLLSGVHASPQALCDGQLQRTRPPPGSCPISCRPLGSVHVQRHGHCPPLDPGLSLAIAFHWPRPLSRETPDSRPETAWCRTSGRLPNPRPFLHGILLCMGDDFAELSSAVEASTACSGVDNARHVPASHRLSHGTAAKPARLLLSPSANYEILDLVATTITTRTCWITYAVSRRCVCLFCPASAACKVQHSIGPVDAQRPMPHLKPQTEAG